MKILITGGTGFIGFNIAKKLYLDHEITVTGFENENKLLSNFTNAGSCLSSIDLDYLKDIDICFHMAANNNTLDQDREKMFKNNVEDPIYLFEKLHENGCKKFVYASSTAIYGDNPDVFKEDMDPKPLNEYAESKLKFDRFAMEFASKKNICVIGLRYCNIYGPHEEHKEKRSSMIYQIYKNIKEDKNPKIFKYGEQKRDWCYVKDVVEANIKCIDYKKSDIFNIASGRSVCFNDVVNIINKNMNKSIEPEYTDCSFLNKYQSNIKCDITKAISQLKWTPHYNIEEGIKDYLNYLSIS